MGSFFSGRELGPISAVAPNSGLGKAANNDPVSNFLFGSAPKYVMPTAGPWAGQAPSLAAANSGYGLNATGNPSLGGGGQSAQLGATFGAPKPTPAQGFLNASAQVAR